MARADARSRALGALERRRGLKAWMLTTTTFLHQCVTNRVTGGRTVFAQCESQLGAIIANAHRGGRVKDCTRRHERNFAVLWEKDEACLAIEVKECQVVPFGANAQVGCACYSYLIFIALTSSTSSSHTQGPRLFKYIRSNSIRVIGLSLGVEPASGLEKSQVYPICSRARMAGARGPTHSSASSPTRFPVLLS